MAPKQNRATKGYRCHRCDRVFTSRMRLAHHHAAEHAPMTLMDIRTVKDIPTMRHLHRGK